MDSLSECELIYEIAEDRKNLERITGNIIRGFACPYGRSSERLRYVLRQLDIVYSRGVGSSMSFGIPDDLLDITPTCRHSDPAAKELINTFVKETPCSAFHDRHPWLFYMWGYSYEFERDASWELIDELASLLGGNCDVWYATNLEVFSYRKSYRELIYSADGGLVFNPTAYTFCLESCGEHFTLSPGETKKVYRTGIEKFVYTER